ncbi:MAG: hypothetical protein KU37_09605 [Sulfuricurvum sp. PC08-66]|nr:MAG: hypothetical protein KU37_09605 [Sulfuricurvum sp. PC08-66]
MRKLLLAFLLLLGFAQAQNNNYGNETIFSFDIWSGLYVKAGVNFMNVGDTSVYMYEAAIAPVFHDTYSLGYTYQQGTTLAQSTITQHAITARTNTNSFEIIHSNFGVSTGYGIISQGSSYDDYAFLNITFDTMMNILLDLKLVATVGYEFTNGVASAGMTDENFSGLILGVALVYGIY